MQRASSPPAAALYEPLTERTLVRIGESVRGALRDHLALWGQRLEGHRRRVPDGLEMNVHMLKDVGAPDWLIDRAEAERRRHQSVELYLSRPTIA